MQTWARLSGVLITSRITSRTLDATCHRIITSARATTTVAAPMPPKRTRKVESEDEASAAEETEVLTKEPASGSAAAAPVPGKQTDGEGNTYFEVSVLIFLQVYRRLNVAR